MTTNDADQAAKPAPPKKKDSPFFEIQDPILIAKIFELATRKHIPVTLWLKNQTIKFDSELTLEERGYKDLVAKYPADFDRPKFQEAMQAQGTAEILGSLNIDALALYYRTTCSMPEGAKHLHLAVPATVFKLQRRANIRIPFERTKAPTVTVIDPTIVVDAGRALRKDELINMRMLDLSVGGCSLASRIEEEAKLKPGIVLREVRFLLRGVEITVDAEIRHTIKTVNDRGKPMLRIGLKFQPLKMGLQTNLNQFVQDESRKIFTLLG